MGDKKMDQASKTLLYYKRLPYTMRIERIHEADGSAYWLAEYLELRGCKTEGDDEVEAVANAQELFDEYISMRLEEESPIPEPPARLVENPEISVNVEFLIASMIPEAVNKKGVDVRARSLREALPERGITKTEAKTELIEFATVAA